MGIEMPTGAAEAPSMQRQATPGKKHQRGERGVRLVKWDHVRPLGAVTHLRGVRSAHSLARPTPPTAVKRRLERVHLSAYLTPRLPDLPPTPHMKLTAIQLFVFPLLFF